MKLHFSNFSFHRSKGIGIGLRQRSNFPISNASIAWNSRVKFSAQQIKLFSSKHNFLNKKKVIPPPSLGFQSRFFSSSSGDEAKKSFHPIFPWQQNPNQPQPPKDSKTASSTGDSPKGSLSISPAFPSSGFPGMSESAQKSMQSRLAEKNVPAATDSKGILYPGMSSKSASREEIIAAAHPGLSRPFAKINTSSQSSSSSSTSSILGGNVAGSLTDAVSDFKPTENLKHIVEKIVKAAPLSDQEHKQEYDRSLKTQVEEVTKAVKPFGENKIKRFWKHVDVVKNDNGTYNGTAFPDHLNGMEKTNKQTNKQTNKTTKTTKQYQNKTKSSSIERRVA